MAKKSSSPVTPAEPADAIKTPPVDVAKEQALRAEIAQVLDEVRRIEHAKTLKEAFFEGRLHQLQVEKDTFSAEMAEAIRQGRARATELQNKLNK